MAPEEVSNQSYDMSLNILVQTFPSRMSFIIGSPSTFSYAVMFYMHFIALLYHSLRYEKPCAVATRQY